MNNQDEGMNHQDKGMNAPAARRREDKCLSHLPTDLLEMLVQHSALVPRRRGVSYARQLLHARFCTPHLLPAAQCALSPQNSARLAHRTQSNHHASSVPAPSDGRACAAHTRPQGQAALRLRGRVRAQVLRTNFIPLADAVAQKLAALLARFCAVYPTLVREYEVRPSSRPRRPHGRRARTRGLCARRACGGRLAAH